MDLEKLKEIGQEIECRVFGRSFLIKINFASPYDGIAFEGPQHGYLLSVGTICKDSGSGEYKEYFGGKYYVSRFSTEGEVVQKILMACIQFVEHEVREGFTYKSQAIFHPHIPLTDLIECSKNKEMRKTLMKETSNEEENKEAKIM